MSETTEKNYFGGTTCIVAAILLICVAVMFLCITNNAINTHNHIFDEDLIAEINSLDSLRITRNAKGCYCNTCITHNAFNTYNHKFDEDLIAEIDSLDSLRITKNAKGCYCNTNDVTMLRQELFKVKKLTKYALNRESKYQMEIDLIIDKYSQWIGYWFSIICIVLALFTFIQYRTNSDQIKRNEKSLEELKKELDKRWYDIAKEKQKMILFSSQNRLSCISVCLSSFPDAFSLTPSEERQRFIVNFFKMLNDEYTEYTKVIWDYVRGVTKDTKRRMLNDSEEIANINQIINQTYLVWCDISIAINHAMFDSRKPTQNIAFSELKDRLSNAIRKYHEDCNSFDLKVVAQRMQDIQNAIARVVGVL